MKNKRTYIRLMTRTRTLLKALKMLGTESYDSVINRLIKIDKVLQKLKKWLERDMNKYRITDCIVLDKIKELEKK